MDNGEKNKQYMLILSMAQIRLTCKIYKNFGIKFMEQVL